MWLRQHVRDSLLLTPLIMLTAGIVLAMLLLEVDERWRPGREFPFVFDGGVEAARPLLSTIATATLTAATLVFSITMLVLQLASGQYSPRMLGSFLRDRYATYSLGLFAATFAFALVVLANTDSPQEDDTRRSFAASATVAFVLVLLSVGGLVAYVNHTAQSIRVSSLLGTAARDTSRAIENLYPEGVGKAPEHPIAWEPTGAVRGVLSPRSGIVTAIDDNALFNFSRDRDVAIALQRRVGEFVAEGTVLMLVYGEPAGEPGDDTDLGSAVLFSKERTMDQDAAFGFRQLVDVSARALSPGVNDPTTAVQALDQVFAALLKLGRRTFPSEVRGGVEYAFEAIGSKRAAEQSFECLDRGGTATIIGMIPVGQKVELHGPDFLGEKRIQGSSMGSNRFRKDMPRYIDFYLQGRLKLDEMITRTGKLEDVNEAFRAMKAGEVARTVLNFD